MTFKRPAIPAAVVSIERDAQASVCVASTDPAPMNFASIGVVAPRLAAIRHQAGYLQDDT